ncbi:competence protein ComK [Paratissierella segnis]|uniref:Competence protein ComK n=1 Tax=Paratissierella segnis TaxID=2763679 RepID=A0A926ESP8_9FIRM|nr:competence protein ComK [Paratissierella segnis]MBC8587513.1 competence protein ComK [Paratissierella segnis]
MEDFVTKDIMAVVPVYVADRGNCTIIYAEDENITTNSSVRNIIKRLCTHYHLDRVASNKYFGNLIQVKNGVPLPLTRDRIFIQLKVRRAIGHCDGTMGYFNLDSIKSVKGMENDAFVILKNGTEIKCVSALSNIKKHMKNGELVRNLYDNRIYTANEAMERYETSNTPATKADIARLYMILQDMSDKIS